MMAIHSKIETGMHYAVGLATGILIGAVMTAWYFGPKFDEAEARINGWYDVCVEFQEPTWCDDVRYQGGTHPECL